MQSNNSKICFFENLTSLKPTSGIKSHQFSHSLLLTPGNQDKPNQPHTHISSTLPNKKIGVSAMEINVINQSTKISKRITTIHAEIKAHRKNIKLLLNVIDNNEHIANTPFAPRIIKYSCIPISERRFLWTLWHLRDQIKLLETELKALTQYCEQESI